MFDAKSSLRLPHTLTLFLFAAVFAHGFTGSGTADSPYLITSTADMAQLAADVNDGTSYLGKFFRLENNLNYSTITPDENGRNYTPIGTYGGNFNGFAGTFDGNDKTISGVIVNGTNNGIGIFGYTHENATIKNLTVSLSSFSGSMHVGAIVGCNKGTITNILVENNVYIGADNTTSPDSHGGIVGTNLSGYVSENISKASVDCPNGTNCFDFGGIIGNISGGYVNNNLYLGPTVKGSNYIGAIAGKKGNGVAVRNNFYDPNTFLDPEAVGIGGINGADIAGQAEFSRTLESMATDHDAVSFIEGNPTDTYSNGISVYSWGLKHKGISYYRSNGTIKLDYNGNMFINGFTCNDENSSCSVSDSTLTIGTAATTSAGTVTKGLGTVGSPYLIESKQDWDRLAIAVSRGNDFSGNVFKLTANISVSTTISDAQSRPFAGTFDGNGKTITAAIDDYEGMQGTALFRYISGATIKNLTVAGSVTGARSTVAHAAGLVGFALSGSNTIENVTVSATIAGGTHVGGIVAHGKTSSLTLTNCVFSGTISGGRSYAGGLLGWSDGSTLNIDNCLFKGSYTGSGKFHPVAVRDDNKTMDASVDRCYYTADPVRITDANIAATGVLVHTEVLANSLVKKITAADDETYYLYPNASPIVTTESFYDIGNEAIAPIPAVTYEGNQLVPATDYTIKYKAQGSSEETANISAAGTYTMVVYGSGDYAGSMETQSFLIIDTFPGEGSEESPYLISSTEDWNTLAQRVIFDNDISGKFFKLTQNINVSTTIGDGENHPFVGTFDGDNKTITATIVESEGKQGASLFRYISGATIKNLTVAGSITDVNGNASHTAGLVGFASSGNNTIENVTVSTTVEGGTHVGGIVAHGKTSSLTLTNCVFSGTISGGSQYAGGLLGWSDGSTLNIENCLFKGTYTGSGNFHPVAVRGQNKTMTATVEQCYYTAEPVGITSAYIAATGTLVHQDPKENSLSSKVIAADGVTYYTYPNSNTISVSNAYEHVNDPITPTPTVMYNGNTLIAGTDYTVKYKAQGSDVEQENIAAAGDYTVVIHGTGNYAGTATKSIVVVTGDGSEQHPYQIASENDWNFFAYRVNHGETFKNKFFVLTADITVSTMVGNSTTNAFMGTFSGNSASNRPTITLAYGNSESNFAERYAAPFRYVNGATFKDLHVAGDIYTSNRSAAGFVASAEGTISIDNCQSSVTIHSSFDGVGLHSGFVAYIPNGVATIQNSFFDGSLLGNKTQSSAGFVGYADRTELILSNILFNPSELDMKTNDSETFYRYGIGSHPSVTFSECYYVQPFGTEQGTRVYVDASTNTLSKKFTAIDNNIYHLYPASNTVTVAEYYEIVGNNPITPAPTSVVFDGNTLTAGTDYTVGYMAEGESIETDNISAGGNYSMVVHGIGNYSGTLYKTIRVASDPNGEGTQDAPYIIATANDWNNLANLVNLTGNTFSGKFFKLTNDIEVTTMVGTSANRFSGTFDGNNHKITIAYGSSTSYFNEEYVAPFRYVNTASIKNLHTSGEIFTSKKYAAGIAGLVSGSTNIFDNCHSDVIISSSVNGDGTHGGLIAHIAGGDPLPTTTITNSYFNGSFLGTSTHSVGGLVGWTYAKVDFANCLFNPQNITVKNDNGRTFARASSYGNLTLSECYYTKSIGTTDQGVRVYPPQESSPFLIKMENLVVDGNTYYSEVSATITGVNPNYNIGTLTTAVVPTVTVLEQSLVQGTDFAIRISKDGNVVSGAMNEDGEYTLTILGTGNYSGSVSTTFWVIHDLDGDGTQNNPYIIANADDWDSFVQKVNNGTTYGGKFVKLTENIEVSTMAGITDGDNRFHGTFDGNGKTITVNYGTSESPINTPYAAPFSVATSATIKNLHTSGTIYTSNGYAAGIAGKTTSSPGHATTIDNCSSNVTIVGTGTNGDLAGLVAHVAADSLAIKNSYFEGSILGDKITSSAGILGWASENTKFSLTNCLFKPTEVSEKARTVGSTLYRSSSAATASVSDCYYTEPMKTTQGQLVAAAPTDGMIYKSAQITAADGEDYYIVASITGIQDKFSFQDFAGFTPVVTINGTALAEGTDYTLTLPTIEGNGEYQVTVTGTGAFDGTYTKSIWVYGKFGGEGTEAKPYIIATTDDWNAIAQMVQDGEIFNGKFLKMTDNISVTEMIGSDSTEHYFAGTFDGNGHTLTVTIGALNSDVGIIGPFRYINGATIKGLHVNGNVYTRSWNNRYNNTDHCYGRNSAGLVGHAKGTNIISNVIVSASISAKNDGSNKTHGDHGGIVGRVGSGANVTIQNSVFNGELLQTGNNPINANGGFVGEGNSTATLSIENSLFNPTKVTMHKEFSHTFGSGSTVTNSYYTSTAFNADQGISGVGKDATELATLLGHAWHVVEGKAVPFYNYSETQYGAVAVGVGDGSTIAYIDGDFREKVETVIDHDIQVSSVTFNRTFSVPSDDTPVYSTIMLPFSIMAGNVDGATFYQLSGFEKVEGKWKTAVVTPIDGETNLTANTPYLLEASKSTISFNQSPLTLNTTTGPETHSVTFAPWEFRGTYSYIAFDDSTDLTKRIYGFVGQEKENFKIGEFARLGSGVWASAMRAYLVYNEGNTISKTAIGGSVNTFDLPETLDVVIVNSEGKSIGGGTINTVTGEIRMDRWFDLQGRKLNGKPTTKGTYYHNGKKVIIK